MDLNGIGDEDVDCTHLALDGDCWWALTDTAKSLWVQWNTGHLLTSLATISFSSISLYGVSLV